MRDFKRGNDRFGGRTPGRRAQRPEMFDAVCDDCGKNCKVPFRPSGDKPIYCSDCFEKRGNVSDRSDDRRGGRDRDNRGRDRDREMFDAICDECGKKCELPFKPSSDKPIYCSKCFENKGSARNTGCECNTTELKELLERIDGKLDKMLLSLIPKVVEKKAVKERTVKEKVIKKKAVKKVKAKKE